MNEIIGAKELLEQNREWQRNALAKIANFVDKAPEHIADMQEEGVWAFGYFDDDETISERHVKAIRKAEDGDIEILSDLCVVHYTMDDIRDKAHEDYWYWLHPNNYIVKTSETILSILEAMEFIENRNQYEG